MNHRSRFRRRDQPRWYGPLGLLAVAVAAVIGYVAYSANSGLPWQDRYRVDAEVPNALRLVRDADVRDHGVLVGEVLDVSAERPRAGGRAYARVQLALDRSLGPLPVDTTVQVRPASALGLTYVDMHLGTSRRTVPDGGTLPLARSRTTVDIPNLLDVFDHSAARNFQGAVAGTAYSLAGRGAQLNATIAAANELAPALGRISATLAAPSTRLAPLIIGSARVVDGLARVDVPLPRLIGNAAVTLGALGQDRAALGEALDAAPSTEQATTQALRDVRPALDALANLVVALRPAGRLLPGSLGRLNAVLAAATRPLAEVQPFATDLGMALRALTKLSRAPATSGALRKLHDLEAPTEQVLSVLTPAQVSCNVLAMWGQYASSAFLAFGSQQGPALANLVVAGLGAHGEMLQSARPASNLSLNPLPNENAQECEAGNETWSGRQQLNNPPGPQSASTRQTVPPPGVRTLAARAGLLAPVEGAR
jgi:phospholipid/cholesterol/gamma-HCH transport system substrate-binding protein